MRLDRFIVFTLRAAITTAALASVCKIANAEDAASRLQKIASVNSLDLPGKTPFHLKMSFQLYDLIGKQTHTGILEEWWAAPGKPRTTIIATSLKQSEPAVFDDSLVIDPRELYLLHELMRAETQPLPKSYFNAPGKLEETSRKFDRVSLKCFDFSPLGNALGPAEAKIRVPKTLCADPKTDTLLLQFNGMDGDAIARKDLGVFHETSLPLELQISYGGRLAIVGKVALLQSFDPVASAISLSSSSIENDDHSGTQYRFTYPVLEREVDAQYSEAARHEGVRGSVLLGGLLTKQGTVKDAFALAAASPLLAEPAMEAFRQYKFKPYLLDGQPIEEPIFIEVNFDIY